jgi:hypothetical protein
MKASFSFFAAMTVLAAAAVSCSPPSGKSGKSADTWNVVAEKTGDLTVCNLSLLKDDIALPLSFFTEELQIVKLDDADDALVKNTHVEVSENYILVHASKETNTPVKLFDRKTGKFISDLGAFGQGPGEYWHVYDQQIDEKNNRIYLQPWMSKQILVYDLKGASLPPIPLCYDAPKSVIYCNAADGTAIISVLPFAGAPAVVWKQTFNGELVSRIEPEHLSIQRDFSNEVIGYSDGRNFDFFVFCFSLRADTMYRYDTANNKLIPLFTLDFKSTPLSIHGYRELPKYFIGDLMELKQVSEQTSVTHNHRYYIVDRETLRGTFFTLANDYLGDMEIEWPAYAFNEEYYAANFDPGDLKDSLTEILESGKDLSQEMKTKLTKLKDSISDDDNNYVVYAKLKK